MSGVLRLIHELNEADGGRALERRDVHLDALGCLGASGSASAVEPASGEVSLQALSEATAPMAPKPAAMKARRPSKRDETMDEFFMVRPFLFDEKKGRHFGGGAYYVH